MEDNIRPRRVAQSFILGVMLLLCSAGLVACGPVPEEPADPGGQSFARGEPSLELAPAEGENGPITSPQNIPQPEGAL